MCKTCPDLSQLDNTIIISGFAAVSSQSFSSPFVSDNNFDNVFGQSNYNSEWTDIYHVCGIDGTVQVQEVSVP